MSAIFDVGLKHSSPSAIMEFMRPNPDITSERVKSHLQKYRLNREKSRKEFMTSYDRSLEGFQKRHLQSQLSGNSEHDEDAEGSLHGSLSCGEAAALLTHSALVEPRGSAGDSCSSREQSRRSSPVPGTAPTSRSSQVSSTDADGSVGVLHLPLLTAQEKDSPLGQAFGYLVGMHQALSQQLDDARKQGGGSTHHSVEQPHSSHQALASAQSQEQHEPQYQPVQQQQQYQPQSQQVYHHILQPVSVEEAAATAAASMHVNDPSIHEVAASIPHAFMVGSRPAVQAPGSHAYHPAQQQPQQHHVTYTHVQAPAPSNGQHSYSSAATAPALGERHAPQAQHMQQRAYTAPAPQPVYIHQQNAVVRTQGNHVVRQHQPAKYLISTAPQTITQHEIPTISHAPNSLYPPPGQAAFAASHSHPPPSASEPPRAPAPAPAMHHPSAPASVPALSAEHQAYATEGGHEQSSTQQRQHHAPAARPMHPPPASMQHGETSPAATVSQARSADSGDGQQPMAGGGRTLQAQKESAVMKQEMKGQMVFQNKIRALKQIELSKYAQGGADGTGGGGGGAEQHQDDEHAEHADAGQQVNHQLNDDHEQELLWNPEDDDQIFDFLMED